MQHSVLKGRLGLTGWAFSLSSLKPKKIKTKINPVVSSRLLFHTYFAWLVTDELKIHTVMYLVANIGKKSNQNPNLRCYCLRNWGEILPTPLRLRSVPTVHVVWTGFFFLLLQLLLLLFFLFLWLCFFFVALLYLLSWNVWSQGLSYQSLRKWHWCAMRRILRRWCSLIFAPTACTTTHNQRCHGCHCKHQWHR